MHGHMNVKLIPAFVPAKHGKRKLPCDTAFKSANLKIEDISETQGYIKEWY